jgi:acid phosphatase
VPYSLPGVLLADERTRLQVPLDAVNYPVAPEGLELQQVHVYVRHGERTPVGVRMAGAPASIPEHWMMCKTARRFRAAVFAPPPVKGDAQADGEFKEDTQWMRKTVERADGSTADGEWYAMFSYSCKFGLWLSQRTACSAS